MSLQLLFFTLYRGLRFSASLLPVVYCFLISRLPIVYCMLVIFNESLAFYKPLITFNMSQ